MYEDCCMSVEDAYGLLELLLALHFGEMLERTFSSIDKIFVPAYGTVNVPDMACTSI